MQTIANPAILIRTYNVPIFLQYELIEFDGIWLTHAEQYRWLQVDYQIGVFISRSSVNLVTINKIWIMAVLQVKEPIKLCLLMPLTTERKRTGCRSLSRP